MAYACDAALGIDRFEGAAPGAVVVADLEISQEVAQLTASGSGVGWVNSASPSSPTGRAWTTGFFFVDLLVGRWPRRPHRIPATGQRRVPAAGSRWSSRLRLSIRLSAQPGQSSTPPSRNWVGAAQQVQVHGAG